MSELPEIHDYYVIAIQSYGEYLSLQLVWREWSRELNASQVTQNRILRFSGVEDLDATLPPQAQDECVSEGWRGVLSRIHRLIFGVAPLPQTARELIACINARGPELGEPLYGVEPSQDGFILETHLSDDFYIRCNSVVWATHSASQQDDSLNLRTDRRFNG